MSNLNVRLRQIMQEERCDYREACRIAGARAAAARQRRRRSSAGSSEPKPTPPERRYWWQEKETD